MHQHLFDGRDGGRPNVNLAGIGQAFENLLIAIREADVAVLGIAGQRAAFDRCRGRDDLIVRQARDAAIFVHLKFRSSAIPIVNEARVVTGVQVVDGRDSHSLHHFRSDLEHAAAQRQTTVACPLEVAPKNEPPHESIGGLEIHGDSFPFAEKLHQPAMGLVD